MADQYEPIAFGDDPPPPPAFSEDAFGDNQYEIPAFGNKKLPPPPSSNPKDNKSDSLASHKGRLSFQSVEKKQNKNKKQQQKLKKNKSKRSPLQDDLKSKSDHKSPKERSGGDEKKSGGSKSVVAISVTHKPKSTEVQSSAMGSDIKKPKRKKTAQEIIALRQRYKGDVKKDVIITAIIIGIALVAIVATIIAIGAASGFTFDAI